LPSNGLVHLQSGRYYLRENAFNAQLTGWQTVLNMFRRLGYPGWPWSALVAFIETVSVSWLKLMFEVTEIKTFISIHGHTANIKWHSFNQQILIIPSYRIILYTYGFYFRHDSHDKISNYVQSLNKKQCTNWIVNICQNC
jgi:hypothetical protein